MASEIKTSNTNRIVMSSYLNMIDTRLEKIDSNIELAYKESDSKSDVTPEILLNCLFPDIYIKNKKRIMKYLRLGFQLFDYIRKNYKKIECEKTMVRDLLWCGIIHTPILNDNKFSLAVIKKIEEMRIYIPDNEYTYLTKLILEYRISNNILNGNNHIKEKKKMDALYLEYLKR